MHISKAAGTVYVTLLWVIALLSAGSVAAQDVIATKEVPHGAASKTRGPEFPTPEPTISEVNRRAANVRKKTDGKISPTPKAQVTKTVPASVPALPFQPPTAVIDPPPGAASASLPIRLIKDHRLFDTEGGRFIMDLAEPSLAVRGREILLTYNVYAAFSRDGGESFAFIDPAVTFPAPDPPYDGQTFNCDQVALYVPQHDMILWYMQHNRDKYGNRVRLGVAVNDDISEQNWRFYDFLPGETGGNPGEWYDYPDLAISERFLFITTNSFDASENFVRAVVMRIPLGELSRYQGFRYRYFDTASDRVGSLRLTQGAGRVMHIGTHFGLNAQSTRSLIRIYSWPDGDNNVQAWSSEVSKWSAEKCQAAGPDQLNWLGESDHRITAAWVANGFIGFGWTAAQDASYPSYPQSRFAMMKEDTKELVAEPHLYNPLFAYGYPAVTPDTAGQVAISVNYGGGPMLYPSHAVGFLDPGVKGRWDWTLRRVSVGQRGPADNRYGDYQVVRPVDPKAGIWAAAGFSLVARTREELAAGLKEKCELRVVQFARPEPASSTSLPATKGDIEALKTEIRALRQRLDAQTAPQPK